MKRLLASAAAVLLSSLCLNAQIKVSGKIVDSSGAPAMSVTVYQTDKTSNGTISDLDGNYSITVPEKGSLTFSCLGYKDVVEQVAGRSTINVTMPDDAVALDAAQVVTDGYSTVAKRDLTGSVAAVSPDEMVKTPVAGFDQALAGRVSGVVVTTSDGAVGSEANIVIRGNNSLTQSSAPLYIIDGFPMESSMSSMLNTADIESIDILKDASATAIYGARGANGVIVITTKSGKEGKPKVNYSTAYSLNRIANKVELMDAYDFVALQGELCEVTGTTNAYLKNHTLEDYRSAKSIDWQDAIYRNALVMNRTLSVMGGNAKTGTNYSVSLSALNQEGIIVNSSFNRYQGKVNLDQQITKHVSAKLLVNYSHATTNGANPSAGQTTSSASGWLMYSVWGYRPTRPDFETVAGDEWLNENLDSGIDDPNDYRFNPAKTVRNEYRKTIVDYLNANLALNIKFLPELSLKISGGYTMNNRRQEAFNGRQTYTGYEGSPSGKGINGAIYWYNQMSWLNDYVLNWNTTFDRKHHLQLTGIFSMSGQKYDYYGTRVEQMTTEELGLKGMHTGKLQTVTPFEYNWTLMSGAARINYNYRYKYYLTASFRADASSKFPKKNRVGYFPSASFAWNFNREDFLKNQAWLSNGKLRVSWGLTGNNRTTTPYDYYARVVSNPGSSNSADYVFDGTLVGGYYPDKLGNEDLRWETTEQVDAGLDLAFFDNRVKFTFDWYLKNTRDLLLEATIPASSGYTTQMRNVGSMRNSGVELSLETVNVRKGGFEWSTSVNVAFNRNIVTALNDGQHSLLSTIAWDQRYNSQYPYITQVGRPSGMMYGLLYEGTYKASDFNNSGMLKQNVPYVETVGREKVQPGDPKYTDINGDGVINDDDRTIIGCGQPISTGGMTNTFTYKGFDLTVFLQWSYGNQILNANRLVFEAGRNLNLNQFTSYNGRYHAVNNPDSDIPRVYANGMELYSSRVVEDGSYLRLKNITLGYSLPQRLLRKAKIENLRIHISADNIATATNYSGPDPEVSTRNSVLTPGFDWSAYPRTFAFTGGLSITF